MPFEKTRFLEKPELICSSCGELGLVGRSKDDNSKLEAKCLNKKCQAFDLRFLIEAKVAKDCTPSHWPAKGTLEYYRFHGLTPIEPVEKR